MIHTNIIKRTLIMIATVAFESTSLIGLYEPKMPIHKNDNAPTSKGEKCYEK